ncbi:MAG: GntR family transcriptional regulator [Burkholderiaceae bacterium]|nr:GntR family transcriptional regulator [Burkholderiaceae bacterium]MDP3423590.1 GntR family transcriptional regulator [Burkholderiaceae bacterium]MDZ4160913.1 GntR family transcriptional regulator [Burkholderiales bacterium]
MIQSLPRLSATPNLVDQVYQHLASAISDGRMAPGTRLTQDEVAEQLAVSRQPVLQALRLLKAEGLVQDAASASGHKGRGLVVAPIACDTMCHIYEVRSALDALAARLAAQARATISAELIEQGRAAAQRALVPDMVEADLAFHRAIYRASGNPLIEPSAMLHWSHIRRAMTAALHHAPLRTSAWDEHEAVRQAIAAGDEDTAAQLMRLHGQQASQHLQALLRRHDRATGATPHAADVVNAPVIF